MWRQPMLKGFNPSCRVHWQTQQPKVAGLSVRFEGATHPARYSPGGGAPGRSMMICESPGAIRRTRRQELIELSSLRSLNIRNGKKIIMGRTGEQKSVLEIAEKYPNLITVKYGEGSVSTNTDAISAYHPLDLTPSRMIGAYYIFNKIPFSLTGNPY